MADMPNVAEPDAAGPAVGEQDAIGSLAAQPQLDQLVDDATAGRGQAAEQLIVALTPSVRRLAQAICGSADDTDEVVQESFLQIFHHLKGFRRQSSLRTWVHRIVLNTALMRSRQRARRPWDAVRAYGRFWEHDGAAASSDDASEQLGGRAMGAAHWAVRPDLGAHRLEMRQKIEAAIAQLPERYRAVFVLRDVEGHDTDTVAEMLGLTLPSVKARLLRARGFLRHALTPYLQTNSEDGLGDRRRP